VILHAGLIARFDPPRWRGVLIDGGSGAGKSDLALRAIEAGWALVADDRTLVWSCDGRLFGRCPDAIDGLIEVRGLGVVNAPRRRFCPIDLVVGCSSSELLERFPDRVSETWLGCDIPRVKLSAFQPSAVAKLNRALTHLGLTLQPAYQADRARVHPPGAGGVP
jgi:serine kinase of HPr protein (carbohydrate metabolism regulator)